MVGLIFFSFLLSELYTTGLTQANPGGISIKARPAGLVYAASPESTPLLCLFLSLIMWAGVPLFFQKQNQSHAYLIRS